MAVENHELEFWLSGGAGNTDPAAALGGARSTAQDTGLLTVSGGTDIAGVDLLAGFARRAGVTGTIQTDGSGDVVSMTNYPDGSNTTELTVSGGPSGTEIGYITMVEGGGERRVAVRIDVDYDVTDLFDSTDFVLNTVPSNLFSEFPAADYTGGETYYRCFYVLNNGGGAIGASLDLNLGYDDSLMTVAWGLDPAGIDGTATTIANEHTAPAGVSFQTTALAFPALAAAEFQAVWVRIVMAASFTPPAQVGQFSLKITDDTTEVYWASMGLEFELSPDEDIEDTVSFVDDDQEEPPVTLVDALLIVDHPVESVTFFDDVEGDPAWPIDEFDVADAVVATLVGSNSLTDGTTFTDVMGTPDRLLFGELEDDTTFTDVVAFTAILGVSIEDDTMFIDVLDAQGEVLDGWTINLETGAASRYEWLRFNSFTFYKGVHYGTTPDGVYALNGTTDAGENIDAFVLTQQAAQADDRTTRAVRGYLGVKFTGDLVLKTITNEGEVNVYSVTSFTPSATMQRHRVTLGRGLKSVYWQFALQNVDGNDFELDTMWVLPVVLSRRLR